MAAKCKLTRAKCKLESEVAIETAVNLRKRWRPLRHTSDVIRHCAGTTVGQTLLIDGSAVADVLCYAMNVICDPVTMIFDFVTFNTSIGCGVVKRCTKFERNRVIRG